MVHILQYYWGINEIMFVKGLVHCLAHGTYLENVSPLHTCMFSLSVAGRVIQKVLLASWSSFCLGSGLLLNVWLLNASPVKGTRTSYPHPCSRPRLWHPFTWTKPSEPRSCSWALAVTPKIFWKLHKVRACAFSLCVHYDSQGWMCHQMCTWSPCFAFLCLRTDSMKRRLL